MFHSRTKLTLFWAGTVLVTVPVRSLITTVDLLLKVKHRKIRADVKVS